MCALDIDGIIPRLLRESINEERITNRQASDEVRKKSNFVGSHTYGEDLGGLGLMYVAYSYGEQHPLYMWDPDDEVWYYNHDDYILPNGKANKWTRKHLNDLRPAEEVQGRPKSFFQKRISAFKRKHHIGDNIHADLEPGEK